MFLFFLAETFQILPFFLSPIALKNSKSKLTVLRLYLVHLKEKFQSKISSKVLNRFFLENGIFFQRFISSESQ